MTSHSGAICLKPGLKKDAESTQWEYSEPERTRKDQGSINNTVTLQPLVRCVPHITAPAQTHPDMYTTVFVSFSSGFNLAAAVKKSTFFTTGTKTQGKTGNFDRDVTVEAPLTGARVTPALRPASRVVK